MSVNINIERGIAINVWYGFHFIASGYRIAEAIGLSFTHTVNESSLL